jgi:hypothetical protein
MASKALVTVWVLAVMLSAGTPAVGEEIEGQLLGVNRASHEVLLDGGIPLMTSEGTEITINGRPAWFDQVKAGSGIKATAEFRGGRYAASKLEVTDAMLAAFRSDDGKEAAAFSDQVSALRLTDSPRRWVE